MARSIALTVPLGRTSSNEMKTLVGSGNEFACCEPRWWVIDVDVRGDVLDTTIGRPSTPTNPTALPPRIPAHLEIGYAIEQGDGPSNAINRVRLIDAIPGRYIVFANNVTVHLLTPATGAVLIPTQGSSIIASVPYPVATSVMFAWVEIGLAPVVGECVRGVTGNVRGQYTWRAFISSGTAAASTEVLAPPNATKVQVWDSIPWEFRRPTVGAIPVTAGVSAQLFVPNALAIGPSAPVLADRDTMVVWEVLL